MNRETLALRGSVIAFVFPAQPELTHDQNVDFYRAVTASKVDLPQFAESPNSVILSRVLPGKPPQQLRVLVDHFPPGIRFMVSEEFPRGPFDLVCETADLAWDSFTKLWPIERLGGQQILSEVTLRFACVADGEGATRFLMEKVFRMKGSALRQLGRGVQGVGLRLFIPVQFNPNERLPLDSADAKVSVETLLEDPSKLFFEITTKWPSVPLPANLVAAGGPISLNYGLRRPSEYLHEVYSYVQGPLLNFLEESAAV